MGMKGRRGQIGRIGGTARSSTVFVLAAFGLMSGMASFPASAAPLPPLAQKYCVACHLPPAPDAMPRRHWTQVFGFMSVWIQEKGLPYEADEYQGLLRDYLALAPEALEPIPDDLAPAGLGFEARSIGRPCVSARPVIAHLEVADLDGDGRPELLVCDAVANEVRLLRPGAGEGWTEETIFRIEAPSRTAVVDYDGDGLPDIAVASLGVLQPTDQHLGSVWLLRNLGEGRFQPEPLLVDCPRVADVKAGDFNGDGRPDLLVVQFGWRSSGGLLWLEQRSPTQFVAHEIVRLHGPLQAEVLDFDGDGRLDFVALFSQEHESLVLFRNDGGGGFESRILARAPHPAYGSAGFSVVDLDGDGDLDFLWTHGDMMDEIPLPKPYHGLHWLENREGELFPRELVRMPGCYRAVAHDLDGDGDLDIVVSSIYPQWDEHDFPSLIWLENDGRQNFTARRLLHSPANLASLVVGDFDGDGLPDLILGGMHVPGPLERVGRLTGVFGLRPGAEGKEGAEGARAGAAP
jgi:hypothetical protein